MPETALDALEAIYNEVLGVVPDRAFDSHQFILALAHRHQRLYVQALVEYADTNRPFQIVHGQIAQRLHNHPTLVRKVGEHNSADIFGQVNSAAMWEKMT